MTWNWWAHRENFRKGTAFTLDNDNCGVAIPWRKNVRDLRDNTMVRRISAFETMGSTQQLICTTI